MGKNISNNFANIKINELNTRYPPKPDIAQLGIKSDLKSGCLFMIYGRFILP